MSVHKKAKRETNRNIGNKQDVYILDNITLRQRHTVCSYENNKVDILAWCGQVFYFLDIWSLCCTKPKQIVSLCDKGVPWTHKKCELLLRHVLSCENHSSLKPQRVLYVLEGCQLCYTVCFVILKDPETCWALWWIYKHRHTYRCPMWYRLYLWRLRVELCNWISNLCQTYIHSGEIAEALLLITAKLCPQYTAFQLYAYYVVNESIPFLISIFSLKHGYTPLTLHMLHKTLNVEDHCATSTNGSNSCNLVNTLMKQNLRSVMLDEMNCVCVSTVDLHWTCI